MGLLEHYLKIYDSYMELILLFAGAVIGGLLSWLITHLYYVKASGDQSQQLGKLSESIKPKGTLRDFESLLEKGRWKKELINQSEVWMSEEDNTFQIERGEWRREFRERWTDVYPDANSSAYPVYLKINNNIIKEITFISLDGGRIFVPMPEIRPANNDGVEYFWNMGSVALKVCGVIGEYYIYKDIKSVAKQSKITLVE